VGSASWQQLAQAAAGAARRLQWHQVIDQSLVLHLRAWYLPLRRMSVVKEQYGKSAFLVASAGLQ
jgi:hypothetical protein